MKKLLPILLFAAAALTLALTSCNKNKGGEKPTQKFDDVLTAITDPAFKAYAQSNMTDDKWDTDGNGKLSESEAAAVKEINLSGGYGSPKVKVESMAGLKYFTGLEVLRCDDNSLATLDVSANKALVGIYCDDNALTTLDVSANKALEDLGCSGNSLTTLKVSGCTALYELRCQDNELTTLDMSGCAALSSLSCYDNPLTTLDLSGCEALYELFCENNQLATLDVSDCTAMMTLYCYGNRLAALDVSAISELAELRCGNGAANPMAVTVATRNIMNLKIAVYGYDTDGANAKVTGFGTANTKNGVTMVVPGMSMINDVVWATRNVNTPGTFVNPPENFGMLYQWNRRTGWSSVDPMIDSDGETIWDDTNPSGTEWAEANDPCPTGWRVPKRDELGKLYDNSKVTRAWTTTPGPGYTFTDNRSGISIFLPAAGCRDESDGSLYSSGTQGWYWSSQLETGVTDQAWAFYFGSDADGQQPGYTPWGYSVRCVWK